MRNNTTSLFVCVQVDRTHDPAGHVPAHCDTLLTIAHAMLTFMVNLSCLAIEVVCSPKIGPLTLGLQWGSIPADTCPVRTGALLFESCVARSSKTEQSECKMKLG